MLLNFKVLIQPAFRGLHTTEYVLSVYQIGEFPVNFILSKSSIVDWMALPFQGCMNRL